MPFKLSESPATKYSASEMKLFKLLTKRPKTTDQLVKGYYRAVDETPFHGREIVISTMSSLIRKMEYNHEMLRIVKSPRRGPQPMEFYIEPRQATKGQAA